MKKTLYNICVIGFIVFCLICRSGINEVQKTDSKVQSKLVILMYHGFTDGGKESDYVIDVKKLEEDILYLKENGFHFIDTSDLTKFKEKKHNLPAKCVMITFDDGYLNNYTYAFPIIKKHNVKVVISPIAYYVDGVAVTEREYDDHYATNIRNEAIRFSQFELVCAYPITAEQAWNLANAYWDNQDGCTDGAAGSIYTSRIVLTGMPDSDTQYYRVAFQVERTTNGGMVGYECMPPREITTKDQILVNALTGEITTLTCETES